MQLGDLAIGQGDDRHAGKAQAFEETGDVFLVATEPVQGLGQNQIEPAGGNALTPGRRPTVAP